MAESNSKAKRGSPTRFGLRALMIVLTAFCCYFGLERQRAAYQMEFMAELESVDAQFVVVEREWIPRPIRSRLGPYWGTRVESVTLAGMVGPISRSRRSQSPFWRLQLSPNDIVRPETMVDILEHPAAKSVSQWNFRGTTFTAEAFPSIYNLTRAKSMSIIGTAIPIEDIEKLQTRYPNRELVVAYVRPAVTPTPLGLVLAPGRGSTPIYLAEQIELSIIEFNKVEHQNGEQAVAGFHGDAAIHADDLGQFARAYHGNKQASEHLLNADPKVATSDFTRQTLSHFASQNLEQFLSFLSQEDHNARVIARSVAAAYCNSTRFVETIVENKMPIQSDVLSCIESRKMSQFGAQIAEAARDPRLRPHAMEAFRKVLPDQKYLEPIVRNFASEADDTRWHIAGFLKHYPEHELTLPILKLAADDEYHLVRAAAARSLGYVDSQGSRDSLNHLVEDSDTVVSRLAREAFEKLNQ